MSYSGAVSVIRTVSESVNPTGLFSHSNKWTASLNFSEVNKQIYLYPMSAAVDLNNHYYESWSVVMGFYFQDAQDSTPEQQQIIIEEADLMVTNFLNDLKLTEGIDISDARKEPSYRQMSGTYTGYILTFTLNTTTDLCAL